MNTSSSSESSTAGLVASTLYEMIAPSPPMRVISMSLILWPLHGTYASLFNDSLRVGSESLESLRPPAKMKMQSSVMNLSKSAALSSITFHVASSRVMIISSRVSGCFGADILSLEVRTRSRREVWRWLGIYIPRAMRRIGCFDGKELIISKFVPLHSIKRRNCPRRHLPRPSASPQSSLLLPRMATRTSRRRFRYSLSSSRVGFGLSQKS